MSELSVIMPVYNEKIEWVKQSVESILNQTFKDFEFIIILDNPNNTQLKKLLLKYSEKDIRIKLIENKENIGLVKSLNRALALCKGEFIARMDADDISDKYRFEKQIEYLNKNKEIKLVGCNWECIDEDSNIIFKHGRLPEKYKFIRKNIKYNNMFLHPSWMFRKEILNTVNEYREIAFAEDYDFICRLLSNNIKISNINEYLIKYRIRSSSISMSKAYEQYVSSNNIIKYTNERKKIGYDTFNENEVIYIDEARKMKFYEATSMFIEAREKLNDKRYVQFLRLLFVSFIYSKDRSRKNINLIIYNLKLKLFG